MAEQWYAWFNGRIVPEIEARVPFRDQGFKYGDAVFDTTRTFNHRLFKLDEHIERLYRSLAYLRIDPGLTPVEMMRITEEVVTKNLEHVPKGEDIWATQRITRGIVGDDKREWPDYPDRTVIVECRPLPYRQRARFYRDGIEVVIPSVRRTPPDAISPRAKTHNYLNLILADLEVKEKNPDALAVLLDTNGNLCEGRGSNIFLVRSGEVVTPNERYVLPGVSRQTAIDLARENGLTVHEADIDLYDALTADEAFITSTSFCVCPVGTINGARIGDGTIPGPVTKGIMDAYVNLVECDWVGQYLRYVNE
jgi:branched-chain amino acid aminotransferase